ncbi:hypothetical protein PENTCL1PPCAC_1265, partial [Pristionchus entomophagus]
SPELMTDLNGYQVWLSNQKGKPAFINNYWSALLAHEMDQNKESDTFKIPYFIVEEELMKEDKNMNVPNKEKAYYSSALINWIVHLLKPYNDRATVHNYEEVLRDFLDMECVLPTGIDHPLTMSTSFHFLPTECKSWIFYMLQTHNKAPSALKALYTDTKLGNVYYLFPDCRLYVHITKSDIITLPIGEDRLLQPWGSLYRFVHMQQWIMLCEDKDGWDVVWKAFMSYKQNNAYGAIRRSIESELYMLNLCMNQRYHQRTEFDDFLNSLAPILRPGEAKTEMVISSNVHTAADDSDNESFTSCMEALDVKERNLSTIEARKKPHARLITRRCWHFPQCRTKQCEYTHPRTRCKNLPNCRNGWKCTYLHDYCPRDAYCEEPNCPNEHKHSPPTFFRVRRDMDTTNRPVASGPPLQNTTSDQSAKLTNEPPRPQPAAASNKGPKDTKRRCHYYPQCTKETNKYCKFWHPSKMCTYFASGKKCAGSRCLFKHGTCATDGECRDLKCAYEHFKSPPVLVRMNAEKRNNGSLSRATSVSNLSVISGRSRRKSVAFDDDSDDESVRAKSIKTNSTADQSTEKSMEKPDRERCYFRTRCNRRDTCEYEHPSKKCPAFPRCPNGGLCIFLHEVCKNDGVCGKENCDYEHNEPHELDNKWCRNKSRCKKLGCKFIHPKECIGPCPTPDECWMYHRPVPPPPRQNSGAGFLRPGYGPGPSFPGGAGYGPMQQQFGPPPPACMRYGYGPDSGYRPTGPGYPQGPGVPPMHGYGSPGPAPYGPGYTRGPGGTSPVPSPRTNVPHRPTTPGPSPLPPSDEDHSNRDGEKPRKREKVSDRF